MKRFSYGSVFFWLFIIGFITYIYRSWFIYPEIIGGDWPYYYDEFLRDISIYPVLWPAWLGNGMGGMNPLLGLGMFSSLLVVPFTNWLHIPWVVVYKIGWFGFFLVASVLSIRTLLKTVASQLSEAALAVGAIIYTTNTYVLMLAGGGQMGVALAYGIAPLVISLWVAMIRKDKETTRIGNVARAGVALAVILALDPRIAYVTLIAIGMYLLVTRRYTVHILLSFVGAGVTALLLNAFWLLPMVFLRSNPLEAFGSAFTSIHAVKFFSFADFSHALSLLHPNWPENIFGKIYFLQPIFVIIPIIAFSSLFWMGKKSLFFALLALVGAFLAKGANEPFGWIYIWLFERVPGFVMFRDPTKFYLIIAMSYSVLVPYVIDRFGKYTKLLTILVVIFWSITIRQTIFGGLGGTFARHTVPVEYTKLQELLKADTEFSRTLWVPHQQRFSFASFNHMPVEAASLFEATSPAQLRERMHESKAETMLADIGVGYVMVPYDSLGELFIKDRRYDDSLRKEYEGVLDEIPWLTKIRSGAIAIYKTRRHRDLFSLPDGERVPYQRQKINGYNVSFATTAPSELLFSQNYHPGWIFVHQSGTVAAQKTDTGLIAFPISKADIYTGTIFFEPQKYVDWGIVVSLVSCIVIVVVFGVFIIV